MEETEARLTFTTEHTYGADTGRLARQATDTPDREIQDLNYSYDEVGNMLAKAGAAAGGGQDVGAQPSAPQAAAPPGNAQQAAPPPQSS